jgi:hypothetical protein
MNEFGRDIICLCRELENWRTECRLARENDPNDFPPFERKAGFQSLIFFIALLIVSYAFPYVHALKNPIASLAAILTLIISLPAAPLLFLFQAVGLAKKQFWRTAFRLMITPRANYPFSTLIYCVEHDVSQEKRLSEYSIPVLTATLDRIGHEESELRERLTIFVGNPTVFVIFGAITGILTAWENYNSHPGSLLTPSLFVVSIGSLLMSFFGFSWRISLTELMRCRALLAMEIARRQAKKPDRPSRRHSHRQNHNYS